jgi:hypothetical protein
MAKVNNLQQGVEVLLSPEEVLTLPFDGKSMDFQNALCIAAWKLLWAHARKYVTVKKVIGGKITEEPKVFAYRDARFVDGFYTVMFYLGQVQLPPTPPNP